MSLNGSDFNISKSCENLDEVFESDDFKNGIQIVLQESGYSKEEVGRIYIKIFGNTTLPPEDEKELEEIFNKPIVQAKTKTLLRRLGRKLPENSPKFMRELLSDDGFNFLVDRIKRKLTTVLSQEALDSTIGGIEIEIYLERLSKELGIGKLGFSDYDWMLLGEIGFVLIDEDGKVIHNSGDLGIGVINNFFYPNNTNSLYMIGDLGIVKFNETPKIKVITTGDLEIGRITIDNIEEHASSITINGEKGTVKLRLDTLKVEY